MVQSEHSGITANIPRLALLAPQGFRYAANRNIHISQMSEAAKARSCHQILALLLWGASQYCQGCWFLMPSMQWGTQHGFLYLNWTWLPIHINSSGAQCWWFLNGGVTTTTNCIVVHVRPCRPRARTLISVSHFLHIPYNAWKETTFVYICRCVTIPHHLQCQVNAVKLLNGGKWEHAVFTQKFTQLKKEIWRVSKVFLRKYCCK